MIEASFCSICPDLPEKRAENVRSCSRCTRVTVVISFLVIMRYCVRASYHQLSDSKRYRVRACFKFGFTHHCCYHPQNSDVFSHLDEFSLSRYHQLSGATVPLRACVRA